MTVEELIQVLKTYPPDLEVVVPEDAGGYTNDLFVQSALYRESKALGCCFSAHKDHPDAKPCLLIT